MDAMIRPATLLALATLAFGPAAQAREAVTCPAKLGSAGLTEWQIVEGNPTGDGILAPSDEKRAGGRATLQWDLKPYQKGPLNLRCTYGALGMRMMNLAPDYARCTATGTLDAQGRVAIPMAVTCN